MYFTCKKRADYTFNIDCQFFVQNCNQKRLNPTTSLYTLLRM